MVESGLQTFDDVPAGLRIRSAHISGEHTESISLSEAIAEFHRKKHMMWIHVEALQHDPASNLLRDRMGFHELAVEDALSTAERPSLQEFEGFIFLVLPTLKPDKGDQQYAELACFLTKSALITVSLEPIGLVDSWFERWLKKPKPLGATPGALLHSIIDAVVDDYFPAVETIEDEMEDLTDELLEGGERNISSVLPIKRRLLRMRRQLAPIRDVVNSLLRKDVPFIDPGLRPYFQDVLDHTLRVYDIVESNRETLASLVDIHLSAVSNNLNQVMKKMTVIATVLMLMTLIAGIYGMNFKRMPELEWVFGYPFAIGLMFALSGIVLYFFRRNRWL